MDFGASDGPMTDGQIAAVKGNVAALPHGARRGGRRRTTFRRLGDAAQVRRRHRWPTSSSARSRSGTTRGSRRSIRACSFPTRTSSSSTARTDRARRSSSPTTSSKVSPDWKRKVGRAKAVQWPVGLGGKGNEGVTAAGQADAGRHRLRRAGLRHAQQPAGRAHARTRPATSSQPSIERVTAAAGRAPIDSATDFRVSITNAPGAEAYPISSFTWLLVHKRRRRQRQGGRGVHGFLRLDARARGAANGGRARVRARCPSRSSRGCSSAAPDAPVTRPVTRP